MFSVVIKWCEDLEKLNCAQAWRTLWEEEIAKHGPGVVYALIDGNHRYSWYVRMIDNEIVLPEGEEYARCAAGAKESYFVPEGGVTLEDLEEEHKLRVFNTKFTLYDHKGMALKQCFKHIVNTNSQSAHTRPQLRKMQDTKPAHWISRMDEKYHGKLSASGRVSVDFLKTGNFLNVLSRTLCMAHYINSEGFGTVPILLDDGLDNFFELDLLIPNKTYELAEKIIDQLVATLLDPSKPLMKAYSDKKKHVESQLIWGYIMFLLVVENSAVHYADVAITDHVKAAIEFAKLDKFLEDEQCAELSQKEWANLDEDDDNRLKADGSKPESFTAYYNSYSYTHWRGAINVKKRATDRYNRIVKHVRQYILDYINGTNDKAKIFRVIRNSKTAFNRKLVDQVRKEQKNLDALTGRPLSNNIAAHHAKDVQFGGATDKDNLKVLEVAVHEVLHNNPKFKDKGWDELVPLGDAIFAASQSSQQLLSLEE
tara:strand:- start:110 stop:1555 length:1446 start_codon:yes stop_codon:yes gene_type:complete